jgi:glycosyltransferase involved in cell wall biosynthesis
MRILFLNSYQTVYGGAERLLFDTAIELVQRGHKVSLVIAHDDRRSPNPEVWPAQVNRYYVPELTIPLTDQYAYQKMRNAEAYRQTLRYLQDIIDIESPDVVHVHNFPRVEVLQEIRVAVPIVRTIHSYENLCGNQLKRLPDGSICNHKLGTACLRNCGAQASFKARRVRAENRFMRTRFAKVLAVSSYVREVLLLNGFDERRIRVLNNFTRLTPEPMDVAEENAVLYAGRMTAEKGLLELVESISLTRTKPKLVVIGKDGVLGRSSYCRQVIAAAGERGVAIELQSWRNGDELRRAYQRVKAVAFSSVWPEPFGLVGIEAMMQARPVVAFDCGGVRDWLEHGETGLLASHRNLRAYAEALDQLLSNDELRQLMGARAQRTALGKFSAAAYINGLLEVYKEVIGEDSPDRSVRRTAVPDAQRRPGVFV